MLKSFLLCNLCNCHQCAQVIVSFIFCTCQDKHDADGIGSMRKFNSVTRADKQDVEFFPAFDNYMRNSKAGLNDSPAFFFTLEKFLEKNIFVNTQPFLKYRGNPPENLFGGFPALYIENFTFFDKPWILRSVKRIMKTSTHEHKKTRRLSCLLSF